MRRYISHLFTWVISFLTLLAFSSCLNEHPKDQLDGGGSNGSASEIFDTTIAPLYDFMGGAIEGEGIRDIQRLDSLLSLSPDDEQLYSSMSTTPSFLRSSKLSGETRRAAKIL